MARPRKDSPIDGETQAELNETQNAAPEAPAAVPRVERQYRGSLVLDHDLFKLLPAEMLRNASYTSKPNWVRMEHAHIFHTIDSNGRKQTASNHVGGHYHLVTVLKNPDGTIQANPDGTPKVEVSPPMWRVPRKDPMTGEVVQVDERVPHDSHVHGIEYLGSEKINVRSINVEAAKFDAQMRQKMEPKAVGVVEGA